ncbi:MAG TPA: hypothetical protein VFW79_10145 [Cellulomonas sp.]|uniref:hypothetical protein n=1 Tax=Cellulomonas sp. TaxID=40001 RepID=UPI002E2EBDB3|nr:hypothetical protein [Cellulomonas sp.]HEX5332993.1 hypothetical protein [Cellulomonas sp.]
MTPGPRPLITARSALWVARLAALLLLLGVAAALWGTAYAVNGMTQAPARVKVPVMLIAAEPQSGWGNVPLQVPGVVVPEGWLAGAQPTGVGPSGSDGRVTVAAWGSTRVEQLLGRGDGLVRGIGLLVGAVALQPVLRSISSGRPFARGNARRIAVVAGTVGVVGVVAPLLPRLAGRLVLERTGLAGTGAFALAPALSLEPLLVAALVLVVAAAFRAGETMARDMDGLV